MTLRLANTFRDDLKPVHGMPTIWPNIGTFFDTNNDLWIIDNRTVLHRDGHVTKGSPSSVLYDALIEYNRRHMRPTDFADYYADDPSELNTGVYEE